MMARIFCVLLLISVVACDQEDAESGKCERIRLSQCQDLGYNWTAMPNLMGHSDQKEAEEATLSGDGYQHTSITSETPVFIKN
ncbi:Frizzled-10 [Danaus plexippus plexippus]|uniref:Frizzled-10 n=1 Tax=Danaus plexippus plexippus TaxID=278856 RepID=A0A212FEG7_DANPL|nr:Frizzled-10 [Danaus plexippus plexippus]